MAGSASNADGSGSWTGLAGGSSSACLTNAASASSSRSVVSAESALAELRADPAVVGQPDVDPLLRTQPVRRLVTGMPSDCKSIVI
jgi:hypothetical protein